MKNRIIIVAILMTFVCSAVTSIAVDTSSEPTVQLPKGLVTMRAEYGANSWFVMNISDVPEGYDVIDGQYYGWCAQENIYMNRGIDNSVYLYSSYDPNMPQNFSNANWSKINYIINHKQGNRTNIQNAIWYYVDSMNLPSDDSNALAMINDSKANGSGFVPRAGETIAILVDGVNSIQRSFLELTVPETPSPGGNEGPRNHAPTADATAGQPYVGFVGQEVIFNGSRSYDRDGTIVSYHWTFGDGGTGSEAIVAHVYYQPGIYTVRLTVTDDDGATNTHTVTANITWENWPPEAPVVTGPESGEKNTSYEYIAISMDVENDLLQYTFNWGDGENTTTEFLSGATVQNHSWAAAGRYTITVKAFDNRTESGATTFIVLIDAIYVGNLGYLIDTDGDGDYDSFYSNVTGTETQVGTSNGNYLLDTNGDGNPDYQYNPFTNETIKLSEGASSSEGILNGTTLIAIGIVLAAIILLIVFFVLAKNKKGKT